MRTIETKKKKGGDSRVGNWEGMNLLDREIYLIVHQWKLAHDRYAKHYKKFLRSWNKKRAIRTLHDTDNVLRRLASWAVSDAEYVTDPFGNVRRLTEFPPLITFDEDLPRVRVKVKGGKISTESDAEERKMSMIELYTNFGTRWIADQLARSFKGGRPPEKMIAACGNDLAHLFEKETGRPQWRRVAEIVIANFPGVLSDDDGRRDITLWIYNLVDRLRKRNQLKNRQACDLNATAKLHSETHRRSLRI